MPGTRPGMTAESDHRQSCESGERLVEAERRESAGRADDEVAA
jgi:hypothetical protein